LAEFAAACEEKTGRKPSRQTVSEHLSAAEITRKRLHAEPAAKNSAAVKAERKEWLNSYGEKLTVNNSCFFDETSIDSGVAPAYGWAPKGELAIKTVPQWKGARNSIIGAFSGRDGLSYRLVFKGAAKADDFTTFFQTIVLQYKTLLKKKKEPFYFIYDNGSVHPQAKLEEIAQASSPHFHAVRLPRYSSRLNPIEQVWHALKAPVKKEHLSTQPQLEEALAKARLGLAPDSFPRYFEHMQRVVFEEIRADKDMH
jgi:transposase